MTATLLSAPEALRERRVVVEGDDYRHLFRARRLRVGERLRVVDGRGRARWGTVDEVDRRRGIVRLEEEAPSLEPTRRITVVAAPLRPERAAWLVEKATEVGAVAIRFLRGDRVARSLVPRQLERLRRVARAAVEQCGRALLPELSGPHAFEELSRLLTMAGGGGWYLDRDGRSGSSGDGDGALLVGPEGGWSEAERHRFSELGLSGLTLGPRVLRAETAAVVGLARLVGRDGRGPGSPPAAP